jgi:hypothetical protein
MKIFTPGYLYELENFEAKSKRGQTIQFIEKKSKPQAFGLLKNPKLVTVADGTTNEEVLLVLIDRLRFLGEKLPSRENSIAVTKLEEALLWLEKRTRDRQARGVENTRSL